MSAATFSEFLETIEQDPELAAHQREMKPSRDLALMLVAIRKRLNLTQSALARAAGVSQSYIAQLESGAANPSIRSVDRLLRNAGIAWRMEATIAATPALDSELEETVTESCGADRLTDSERSHLLQVVDGVATALRRARLDGRALSKDVVLREIAAAYDAERRSR